MHERRLAAIMFTDIVGYTALMERDEAYTLDLINQNREIQKEFIKSHNGQFIKEIGDATLSIFPSSSEAVRCAQDILSNAEHIDDLLLRIGIHLGEIQLKEGDIYGDGVNVAARIQNQADPGTIFISEAVEESIKSIPDFNLIPLGKRKLKNVSKPVELYKVNSLSDAPSTTDRMRKIPLNVWYVAFVIAAIFSVLLFYFKPFNKQKSATNYVASEMTLAVLPYTQIYDDSTEAYICSMISEIIRDQLSEYPDLRILKETSSAMLGVMEIREVQKDGTVTHLVTGNYQKQGGKYTINTVIKDVSSGLETEIEKQRCYKDGIEEAGLLIGESILKKIGLEIADHGDLGREVQEDVYVLFQQGKFSMNKLTPAGYITAKNLFSQAIELEPNYAKAYAFRALSYLQSGLWLGLEDPIVSISNAQADIDIALTIDPNESTAYEAQAFLENWYLWDREKAEENFLKAKSLNNGIPSLAYGAFLWQVRRYDESVKSLEQLRNSDPYNTSMLGDLGLAYHLAGRKREAFYTMGRCLMLQPKNALFHHMMAQFYMLENDYDKAREHVKIADELIPEFWPFSVYMAGLIYARDDDWENAQRILAQLDDFERQGLKGMGGIYGSKAMIYAFLGDYDMTIESFQEGIQKNEINMVVYDAWLDFFNIPEIRTPEYIAIMSEAGLLYESK